MELVQTGQTIDGYLKKIDAHIKSNHDLLWIKYVKLGSKTVKLLCYSQDFVSHIMKQLSYTLCDNCDHYDATIMMWNQGEVEKFANQIVDSHAKLRMRLDKMMHHTQHVYLNIMDDSYSKHHPVLSVNAACGIITAFDQDKNIYYYGVSDLSPEQFIKQGHIFVQLFNKIVKSPQSHLVHGAAVGIDNKGILFCARGQRGKSTLAVLSMMEGFDYVSDDYLVLEKEDDGLYSYPIYSIITLSPKMYHVLYDDLKGKFVSNNVRRDKYVIDIKAYHDRFRSKYPIKLCMFPQITDDAKPSIVPCKKGRAITQLIHSTIGQLQDTHDITSVQKLMAFVKDFDFYQINLCSDIYANVECLRQFCNNLK